MFCRNPINKLYTLSYVWYSLTAVLIVVVVGMTVSLITGMYTVKMIVTFVNDLP